MRLSRLFAAALLLAAARAFGQQAAPTPPTGTTADPNEPVSLPPFEVRTQLVRRTIHKRPRSR